MNPNCPSRSNGVRDAGPGIASIKYSRPCAGGVTGYIVNRGIGVTDRLDSRFYGDRSLSMRQWWVGAGNGQNVLGHRVYDLHVGTDLVWRRC